MNNTPGTNYFTPLDENVKISLTNEEGFAVLASCVGNPNVVALHENIYNTGCEIIRDDILTGKNVYYNEGTRLNPTWVLAGGGSGSAVWGDITGTLSDQTDLQDALDNKVSIGLFTASGLTMNTNRLLGRTTAGVGASEEITVGSGLTFSGTTLAVDSSIVTGLLYKGTWNASTNTPTLASGVGTSGDLYIVSVAGTTTLDGISSWAVGDFLFFNGTVWQQIAGTNLTSIIDGTTPTVGFGASEILFSDGAVTRGSSKFTYNPTTDVFQVTDGTDGFLRISAGSKTFAIGDYDGAGPYIESNLSSNEIQLVANILEFGGNRYTFPAAQGTAGQVLAVDSVSLGVATLDWITPAASGITGSGAANRVTYWTGASTVSSSSAFLWNDTTKTFTITNGGTPAKRAFTVDALGFDVAMGDVSDGGNSTSLFVSDSSKNIQAIGGDGLGNTGAVLDIYTDLTVGAVINIGDVSGLVNGTLFEVNDASQYIRMGSAATGIKGFDIDFGSNIFSFGDYTGVTVGGSNVGFLSIAPNIFSLYGEDGASGVNRFLAQTGGILYQGDVDGAVTGASSILDFVNSTFNLQSGGARSFDIDLARFNTIQGDVDLVSNGVIFEVNDQNQYIRGTIGARQVLNLDRANELYEIGRITGGNTTHISIDDSARDIDLNSRTVTLSGVSYIFPLADGTSGQALSTNGAGILSWATLGGVTTVGTINSATPSANGAVISGTSIVMQSASSTRPGLVDNTTQIFSGLKAFSTGLESTVATIIGTGGAGYLDLFSQSSTPSAPSTSFLRLWQQSNRMFFSRNGGIDASIDFNAITADRNYAFPDLAGTVALLTGAQTFTDKIISVVSGANTATQSRVGGSYATSTTAASNSGSGETNLFSTAIGANTLNTNGDKIRFKSAGTFNTSANNKRLRVKFGGTTIYDSTALAITTANSWIVEGEIIRSSSTAVKVSLNVSSSSALLAATTVYLPITGLTLSNSNNLDITGQGTASADITGEMLSVDFMPN